MVRAGFNPALTIQPLLKHLVNTNMEEDQMHLHTTTMPDPKHIDHTESSSNTHRPLTIAPLLHHLMFM